MYLVSMYHQCCAVRLLRSCSRIDRIGFESYVEIHEYQHHSTPLGSCEQPTRYRQVPPGQRRGNRRIRRNIELDTLALGGEKR